MTEARPGSTRLPAAHLGGLPYSRLDDRTFDLPGVVCRRKQLVPMILNAIQA